MLNEKEYRHVIELLQGTKGADAVLEGLKGFFFEVFQCEIYAYFCDKTPDGRQRLRYVVWSRNEEEQFFIHCNDFFGHDQKKEQRIKTQFSFLCERENTYLDFWDTNAYFAVPENILEDLLSDIQRKAEPEIERTLNSIPEVKQVAFLFGSVHIFYETDNDIRVHDTDGLSETIEKRVYDIKKRHDFLHACKDGGTVFTSIQTLKEKYKGSTFYYFR